MIFIGLKDACLQVLRELEAPLLCCSREGLLVQGLVFWHLVNSHGLFSRVLAPVSVFLFQVGIPFLRYPGDGLILVSYLGEILQARNFTLQFRQDLEIVSNLENLLLILLQEEPYASLGMVFKSELLWAFLTSERIQ